MIPILMEEMREMKSIGSKSYGNSRLFIRYVDANTYSELLRRADEIDGIVGVGNERFRVRRSQELVFLRFADTSSEEGKKLLGMLERIVEAINEGREFYERRVDMVRR